MKRVIIAALMLAFTVRGQDAAPWWNALAADGAALPDVTDGLVSWWKFDETSYSGAAGEVIDSTGNGKNGTAYGGVQTGVGKINRALFTDGLNDYVSVADMGIPTTNVMSLSFWAKNIGAGNSDDVICIFGNHGTYYQCAGLYVRKSDGYYRFTTWREVNDTGDYPTGFEKDTDVWHHWAIVCDGNTVLIYQDGVSDPVGPKSRSLSFTASRLIAGYASPAAPFNGEIDDVRLYNRALSSNEVNTIYNRYK